MLQRNRLGHKTLKNVDKKEMLKVYFKGLETVPDIGRQGKKFQ